MKKIVILIFLIGVPFITFAYNLSTSEGLSQCKNDANCYICMNDSSELKKCVQLSPFSNILGDVNYSVKDYVCSDKVPCDVSIEDNKTSVTCPLNPNKTCYKDGGGYYCSNYECLHGSNISIDAGKNDADKNDDFNNNINNQIKDTSKKDNCSLDGITIGDGLFMPCRMASAIGGDVAEGGLTQNCCETSVADNEKKKKIITGIADTVKVISGAIGGVNEVVNSLGDIDYIGQVIEDLGKWFTGGICSESEILAGTLSNTTKGIINSETNRLYSEEGVTGNCVYLGDYCTNYKNVCIKIPFLGLEILSGPVGSTGCERPAKAFCCYNSVFDKALAIAARRQIPSQYNWGSVNNSVISGATDLKNYKPLNVGIGNSCKPVNVNLNCSGVSVVDLANINMDSAEFQEDFRPYVDIMVNEITKPGGAIDNATKNMNNEINNQINEIKNGGFKDIINNQINDINSVKK